MAELSRHYIPADFEAPLMNEWEKANCFSPDREMKNASKKQSQKAEDGKEKSTKWKKTSKKDQKTFYIPIPPPNVTGVLHCGHALMLTVEDIMCRYRRMRGDRVLWLPGTDHAGIATQAKVEERLKKQGKTRTGIGREQFLQEAWKWKDEHAGHISSQFRTMGASLDWSRERFTLDADFNALVERTFVELYNKGLIYRGEYMVNYSPALQSVISDLEVDYVEEEGKLYHITYFVSGSDKELIVATTRPETLLGDQALAVHPKDKRYKKLIGRSVVLPIVNKDIPIIADENVEMEYGTGVVKVTPAHDPTDFETGKRHGLRLDYQVIDKMGNMTREAGIFAGQDALTARENVVELLKAKGNLVKVEPIMHRVGYCSRGKCRVESVVSTQWFARQSQMAKKVMAGYKKGEFTIIPDRFEQPFEDWMGNLRDWCISRQLWWGHQIPAYYHRETGELLGVTLDPKALEKKHGSENIRRDDDVLDTWFSSALWPHGALGWNYDSPSQDFKDFYPASVLETGYDILFFWVIRMLLMGYEQTGMTPFKTIYLHGLVLDESGRKMSKSWGNIIDPRDVVKDYSADALRMTLIVGNTPGNNLNLSLKNVAENGLFLNKLWNIVRFAQSNAPEELSESLETLAARIEKGQKKLLPHEKWILSRGHDILSRVSEGMEKNTFSQTGTDLYAFTRDEFADIAIEAFKLTRDTSHMGKDVIAYTTHLILRLWHPYIPFMTEAAYRSLTDGRDFLMLQSWPELLLSRDGELELGMKSVWSTVRALRALRSTRNIKPSDIRAGFLIAPKKLLEVLRDNQSIIEGLSRSTLTISDSKKLSVPESAVHSVVDGIDIALDVPVEVIDVAAEKARLKALISEKSEYIRQVDLRLASADFIKKAPERVVRMEQDKLSQAQGELKSLREKFEKLS